MIEHCPGILALLHSELALDVFVPPGWRGLNISPIHMNLKPSMPKKLHVKTIPIRPELFDRAKNEYLRLKGPFYVDSDSSIASRLVVAPKATDPFVRLCGDYSPLNPHMELPDEPFSHPHLELQKAAGHDTFVDLDMANAFHQIPITTELSKLLSVQTPWGLVRPLFLPEGVSPASGILQKIVREIFADYSDWIIVIYDNFLILAKGYADAYTKFELILKRCQQFNIILKFKKSWIGMKTVSFFGYQVSNGHWQLSDERKQAVLAMTFPTTKKLMQIFLGFAIFFHYFVPKYSDWVSKLYEMVHNDFQWDRSLWIFDYESHFNEFKQAILHAMTLCFPDYTKEWILRCDASDYAIGAVLFQLERLPNGTVINQPISFSSKRFSPSARNWDTFKKEAYAIYSSVNSFSYYLRGKSFVVETDHRNLQWIEMNQSPIVIRWRNLLQSYHFVIKHIPGNENHVADFLSRMPEPPTTTIESSNLQLVEPIEPIHYPSFEQIMSEVHGNEALHFGAYETWKRAVKKYDGATISIHKVRDYVKECPMCQKTRDTGIVGLKPRTLHLKPDTYRRTIGVDHFTVTPIDDYGNTCCIMIVEFFAHFPQAYPAPSYDAHQLALVLFKHYCTFGIFDFIAMDPGSANLSDVVTQLNKWIGIQRKVSLVGRHQSNGCEGSIQQFFRHLQTLVFDLRLIRTWSGPTVLPLINFSLASFPTSETGGFTPFQLKYGTEDATYFRLPTDSPADNAAALLTTLDSNLRIVREKSRQIQQKIVEERRRSDGEPQSYAIGDMILFNVREKPGDMLPSKLFPPFLGPYKVIAQNKNDIDCEHVVTLERKVLHVSRVKPFFGSEEDAYRIGKIDRNQFSVISINYFTGNAHVRNSLSFNVTFEGDDIVMLPYSPDLAAVDKFQSYINEKPWLMPLRRTAELSKKFVTHQNRSPILAVIPNQQCLLHLRYYDKTNLSWYDELKLPDPHKEYFVIINLKSWGNTTHTKIKTDCPLFNSSFVLTSYEVLSYVIQNDATHPESYVIVTTDKIEIYEKLLPWVQQD